MGFYLLTRVLVAKCVHGMVEVIHYVTGPIWNMELSIQLSGKQGARRIMDNHKLIFENTVVLTVSVLPVYNV